VHFSSCALSAGGDINSTIAGPCRQRVRGWFFLTSGHGWSRSPPFDRPTIDRGFAADLVCVSGDPLADISTLRSTVIVVARGHVVTDKRQSDDAARSAPGAR
jgi:hypothetical protein